MDLQNQEKSINKQMNKPRKIKLKLKIIRNKDSEARIENAYGRLFKIAYKI